MAKEGAVPIFESEDAFKRFLCSEKGRSPALWRAKGCIGDCEEKWRDPREFAARIEDRVVKIHVSKEANMDFKRKNFVYKDLSLKELILRASVTGEQQDYFLDPNELYYLRHIGDNPRGERVCFHTDFPEISKDFSLPSDLYPSDRFFSSVLRISSPTVRIWTHYDVLDNFYVQVVGRKRALFWAPSSALDLYMEGDKSLVTDVLTPDPKAYPRFLKAERLSIDLEPGDVLFIPALWFHNMEALSFGVAINVFWKNLEDDRLYDKKDVYGNKDLVPAGNADRMLVNIIKQFDSLPEDYRDFYGRLLINKISKKCLVHEL